MERRGLDPYGYFEREGSLGRVQGVFGPVVAAARERIGEAYGQRLHSAYLYGSVPRGTARPGRSDLDLLLALHHEAADEDRDTAEVLARGLDQDFAEIDGVGILLYGKNTLLSEQERDDLGWFLACLCTPLLGADLAEHLPRYRPDSLLARETNGDLAAVLPRWRARLEAASTPPSTANSKPALLAAPGAHGVHPRDAPVGRLDERSRRVRGDLRAVLPRARGADAGRGRGGTGSGRGPGRAARVPG